MTEKKTLKAEKEDAPVKRGRGRPVGSKTKVKAVTAPALKEAKKTSKSVKQDEELSRRLSKARSSLMTGISAWAVASDAVEKDERQEKQKEEVKPTSFMSLPAATETLSPAVQKPSQNAVASNASSGKVSFDSLMGNVEKVSPAKPAKAAAGKVTLDSLLGL